MSKSDFYLRPARSEDCEKIFKWRNHPEIRKYSLNSKELDYQSHKEWFEKVLADKKCLLLIGVLAEEEVGVLRFDIDKTNRCADLSIYLKMGKQGKGIGTVMMKKGEDWLREHEPTIKKIVASVLEDNTVSLKLFYNAGFKVDFMVLSKKF